MAVPIISTITAPMASADVETKEDQVVFVAGWEQLTSDIATKTVSEINSFGTYIDALEQNVTNLEANAVSAAAAAQVSADEVGTWSVASAFVVSTIADLATIDPLIYTTTYVKNGIHNNPFNYKTVIEINPHTGSLYAADGGTVFAASGGGFWALAYDGAVNVEWFGAIGDGTTDDKTAIQNAVQNFPHVCGAAGKVYRVSDSIQLSKPAQKIYMFGSEIKLDDATGLKSNFKIGDGTTQLNGVELYGITFTRSQVATAGSAIDGNYTGVLKIQHCRVYGDNKIFNGISLHKSIIADVSYNYIQNCVNYGIDLLGTNSTTLRNVDTTIFNNRIEGGVLGINSYDFVEGLVCNMNTIFNTSSHGMVVDASTDANGLFSFMITNNRFDTCGGYGLYIDKVNNTQINAANWFSNIAGEYAVVIKSGCDSVICTDNQMYPLHGGVLIEGTSVICTNNIISGGDAVRVKLQSTALRCKVKDNELLGGTYAIDFQTGFTGGDISGNTFASQSAGTENNILGTINTVFKDNIGDTSVGSTVTITVGASPYTYTAGARPETISIFGGTVSNIQTGGNSIGFATNRNVHLSSNKSVTITYSSLPYMTKTYQ